MTIEPMTTEEETSLYAMCRERLGKGWELRVHQAWMDGHYPFEVQEFSHRLQTLRNSRGFGAAVWDGATAHFRKQAERARAKPVRKKVK